MSRAVLLLFGLLFAGCAVPASLERPLSHETLTVLARDNYVVQDPITVEVECTWLFGPAVGGLQLPGIPLGDPDLHSRAAAALHERSGGRPLIHVARDLTHTTVLGLYTTQRLTVTADTVTFVR